MTQLILKNDTTRQQLDTLLQILHSWNIEAETLPSGKRAGETDFVRDYIRKHHPLANEMRELVENDPEPIDPNDPFARVRGIWANYDINAKDLRRGILPNTPVSVCVSKQPSKHYNIEETASVIVGEPSATYSETVTAQDDDDAKSIDPNDPFNGIRGMWADYDIDAKDLRRGILPRTVVLMDADDIKQREKELLNEQL
jgi:hypothetical protein